MGLSDIKEIEFLIDRAVKSRFYALAEQLKDSREELKKALHRRWTKEILDKIKQ